MPRIGILPLHGFRGLIVPPDIAHDFPFQILLGPKDAVSDEIPLNQRSRHVVGDSDRAQ